MFLLIIEFFQKVKQVPVCSKENQSTDTCNAPGFHDNKRGKNKRNDEQRDKRNVNQRLVELFDVHSSVFLSLLLMILMLIELSHVVKEKQQLYSIRRTIRKTIRLISPYH